jgi:hypothetical protein
MENEQINSLKKSLIAFAKLSRSVDGAIFQHQNEDREHTPGPWPYAGRARTAFAPSGGA